MKGPGHVHRGSNANPPETPGIQHHSSHHPDSGTAEGREGRSLSFSFPTQSAPGTPLFTASRADGGRTASIGGNNLSEQCVIDSSVYFIRTEATPHSPCREILIFGDVEPDSVSLSPRTAHIWAEAAPKMAAGILTGIFIECSYNNSQSDAVLYGHLAPRHLIAELQNLAEMVKEARREYGREKEEQRKGRKRKRASHGLFPGGPEGETSARKGSKSRSMAIPKDVHTDDEVMTDYAASTPGRMTGTQTPTMAHPAAPPALSLAHMSAEHGRALMSATFDSPLKGLKVVIIHVKDTLSDGPLVGESILEELQEAERALQEQGKGLGCTFVISKSGGSYHF
jgi:hypothetical protein